MPSNNLLIKSLLGGLVYAGFGLSSAQTLGEVKDSTKPSIVERKIGQSPTQFGALPGGDEVTIRGLEQLQRQIDRKTLKAKLQATQAAQSTQSSPATITPSASSSAVPVTRAVDPQVAKESRSTKNRDKPQWRLVGVYQSTGGQVGASFRDQTGHEIVLPLGNAIAGYRLIDVDARKVTLAATAQDRPHQSKSLKIGELLND